MRGRRFTAYEFFAGGGMARLGLGERWRTLFANDFDPMKAQIYRSNFGGGVFVDEDIWRLSTKDLPGRADLAWASSPCQDLSLAGDRAGLAGSRSSALMGFWRLIGGLGAEGRAPTMIVIENVPGLISSHGGRDLAAICAIAAEFGYGFGLLEIDAAHFLPQSRRRLFFVASRLCPARPSLSPLHSPALSAFKATLAPQLAASWIDWPTGSPPERKLDLAALLDADETAEWFSDAATQRLTSLFAPLHRDKLKAAIAAGERKVGAVFRRIRNGRQRAEVRFDGLAGCLRTPRGGSSRQILLVVEGARVRSRLLSGREAARLMGAPESYRTPPSANAALRLFGDGVAVPAVRFLAAEVLEPTLSEARALAA